MAGPPTISVGHTLSGRLPTSLYRVEEPLGAGGVGSVYRVVHEDTGESFALKVLHRSHAASDALRRRFEREAQALSALDHPNVVRITDHGTFDGEPYLVMELLLGESLSQRLRRGRMGADEVRRVAGELLSAVAYVHGEGLLHRDLKPGNVFLQHLDDGAERCKVLDFGFAKFVEGGDPQTDPLTRSGEIFGTPAYMAPEQMGGDKTSAPTDVYALGVLLFEMVTGKRPFDGDATDIMRGHLVEDPPPLEEAAPGLVPCRGLAELIVRALEKRPADRFADAAEMLAAFEALPEPLFRQGEEARAVAALGEASTVVAMDAAPRIEQTQTMRRPSLPARALASVGAFVGRVVRASAVALILASLVVIVVSTMAIYGLRDGDVADESPSPEALTQKVQDGLQQTRRALEDKLPPAVRAVAQTAAEAVAKAGAEEETGAEAEAGAGAETGAGAGTAGADEALPPARDPFRRALPPELRKISRMAASGERGGKRILARLRAYNRQHPRDARGHLLLARLYWNRGWREDALTQYELAMGNDASARGAKHMREHLQALATQPKTAERASGLIVHLYGPDALPRPQAQAAQ